MDEFLLGEAAMIDRLERMANAIPGQVGRALYEEAQIELTEAKRRTPWDTGALRASGKVNKPEGSGRELSVKIEFGGPTAGYAIYVHEDLEAFHPYGQAKFLESTLLESAPYMAERIAKRLDFNR